MARNKGGQFVGLGDLEIKLTKHLQKVADEAAVRIRPVVRDELEQTLRAEIYASYTPATEKGKVVKDYNESHKHQKTRLYHHTGILASSIHGTIDRDIIKAGPMDGVTYPDGTSVKDVYNYLKFGTTDTPNNDTYSYGDGQFSKYIAQEPHNFEARTRAHMKQFMKDLSIELQTEAGKKRYIGRYLKKRL